MSGCSGQQPRALTIATTTSVQNSGLLAELLPALVRDKGITVQVHAAGSGRALRMLEQGEVDAVISHAPSAEADTLSRHPEWIYRKIAFNQFVVAGPRDDPAGVRSAADVVDAFRRIHDTGASFVSRGDESGTHEREREFWMAAERTPRPPQLIVSGRGMAQALRHGSEAQAYVLTDEPTFRQLSGSLDLVVLFERDARLLNTYAVVHPPQHEIAAEFAGWLTADEGRRALATFQIGGRPAFEPWPAHCPATRPSDVPCR
jgi:tungstate transport system substrate-binding protein